MQLLQEKVHDNREQKRPRKKAPERQAVRLQRVERLLREILPQVPVDEAHRAEAQTQKRALLLETGVAGKDIVGGQERSACAPLQQLRPEKTAVLCSPAGLAQQVLLQR